MLILVATLLYFILASADFQNTRVMNKISLDATTVKLESTIQARSLGKSSVYLLSTPASNLAYISVVLDGKDVLVEKIHETYMVFKSSNKVLYKVPVPKGTDVTLNVKQVYIGVTSPYPKEIGQMAEPSFEFMGNVHFFSPYETLEEETVVSASAKSILSYTKENDASKQGNTIRYGPFKNVAPFSESPVYVHFSTLDSMLVAQTFSKTVQVSEWSNNLNIQEDFELHHTGPKYFELITRLKGQFSRIDFKLTEWIHSRSSVVKVITAVLPGRVSDVYYKDVVGNVSTSNLRVEKRKSVLELRPRYPLYGGWKYSWFHGYKVPGDEFMNNDEENNIYRLTLSILPSISGLIVKEGKLKVILPESAHDIEIKTDYEFIREDSKTFSYFDTIGKPTITLSKSKIVPEYSIPITITYKLPKYHWVRKPLVVSTCLLSLVLSFLVISKLDFSISKDKNAEKLERLGKYRVGVSQALAKDKLILARMEENLAAFKNDKDIKKFREEQDNAGSLLKSIIENLKHISKETEFEPKFSLQVRELAKILMDRFECVNKMHDQIGSFLSDSKKSNDTSKRAELSKLVDDHHEKMVAYNQALNGQLSKMKF